MLPFLRVAGSLEECFWHAHGVLCILWRPEIQHCLMSSSLFSVCQTHGQDLSTISPASIFESMFQSPDHTANQDDSQQTGTTCICTAVKENVLTALHACTEFSISDWNLMPNVTPRSKKNFTFSVDIPLCWDAWCAQTVWHSVTGEVTQHTVLQCWHWSSQTVHVILFSRFPLEVSAQPGW